MKRPYRITQADADAIRNVAIRASGCRRIALEPGSRVNTSDHGRGYNVNIRLVSDEPDWNDTDLHDYISWAEFRKGFDLTDDGRGLVDFYVYSLGHDGELITNVQAYFEGRRLVRVEGMSASLSGPDTVVWTPDA